MNIRLAGLFFVIAIMGLAACEKNNDAPTIKLMTSLNVVNASVDTVNIYLNGTRLNNNSNLYPIGATGYLPVLYGTQNYQVKKKFDPATSVVKPLFSITLTLDTNKHYSLFTAGEISADAFSTTDTLRSTSAPDSCFVRFVNASPDGGNFDFAVGDNVKFTNVAFKSATAFVQVDTSNLKPIMIYQAGSQTPLLSGHYPIQPGRSYTFFSKGKPNGSGNLALKVGVSIY